MTAIRDALYHHQRHSALDRGNSRHQAPLLVRARRRAAATRPADRLARNAEAPLAKRLLWLLLGTTALVLAGCGSAPYDRTPTPTQSSQTAPQDNADALVQLAQSAPSNEASQLWLAAAQALSDAARLDDAERALQKVNAIDLNSEATFDFGALRTDLALRRFNAPAARALFDELQPLSAAQDLRYTGLAERIASMNIDTSAAASALINAPAPRNRREQQQNSDQIWSLISQTPATQVSYKANTTGGIERAWWQLKDQLLGAFTLTDASGRLTRWQTANPLHPANQTPPAQLIALQANTLQFNHIALLLPQSGPLATAGKAVRDGFFAAHLHAKAPGTATRKRQISVFDTASASLPDLLRQAEAAGADLLVGPLDKNRVAQLNQLPQTLPTLLLNYLPDDTAVRGDIVQFGLAVEDEARAIARRVQAEGLERLVVLHNEKGWSQRAKDALLKTLEMAANTPGAVTAEAPRSRAVGIGSTPDVKQLTAVVGSTLLVDQSQQRHRQLERLLGEDLEFVPRARQDVDAIVAFLDSSEARSLRPALRFHFSSGVPVYTSSQALRRISDRDLRDLRGFNVSEIPWKLYPSAIKDSVEQSFGVTQGSMVPLYALGVDAYRLADRLNLLLTQPHQRLLGGTGELSIEYGGRVQRELAWQYVGSGGLTPLPMVASEPRPETPAAPAPQ